jgi:hypothetical protein
MTGAVDRALKVKMDALPIDQIAHYLEQAPLIEAFIKDLQQMAHGLLEEGRKVPGWKLVNKRATRQWTNEDKAVAFLTQRWCRSMGRTQAAVASPSGKGFEESQDRIASGLSRRCLNRLYPCAGK